MSQNKYPPVIEVVERMYEGDPFQEMLIFEDSSSQTAFNLAVTFIKKRLTELKDAGANSQPYIPTDKRNGYTFIKGYLINGIYTNKEGTLQLEIYGKEKNE